MKLSIKGILNIMTILGVSLFLFAACSEQPKQENPAPQENTTSEKQNNQAVSPSAEKDPIIINWWHAMRSARGEVVEKMIQAFNASQSDYKVVGTFKGNYDETMNAGVAAFRAKKQPHILQVFEVGTQTMMLSGAVYPVFQLMKDAGYDIDWNRYLQAVLSYYMNADGNLMSMPFNSSTPIMYYNVDMFEKAGIPPLSKPEPDPD